MTNEAEWGNKVGGGGGQLQNEGGLSAVSSQSGLGRWRDQLEERVAHQLVERNAKTMAKLDSDGSDVKSGSGDDDEMKRREEEWIEHRTDLS